MRGDGGHHFADAGTHGIQDLVPRNGEGYHGVELGFGLHDVWCVDHGDIVADSAFTLAIVTVEPGFTFRADRREVSALK